MQVARDIRAEPLIPQRFGSEHPRRKYRGTTSRRKGGERFTQTPTGLLRRHDSQDRG